MTVVPELPSSPNQQPLDEVLQTRFDKLLRDTAEQLEAFSTPDELTLETKHAQFGNFGDGTIAVSHTIDRGFHSGAVGFIHPDDGDRSFFVSNKLEDGSLWTSGKQRFTGRKTLQLLHRNWPIADNQQLDELTTRIHADDDVDPRYILELLENYAVRQNTGEREYEMRWDYHDVTHNVDTEDTRIESVAFNIFCDGKDDLRQVQADIVIPYIVNEVQTPLTCNIHSNEIGDVMVSATYLHPTTLKRTTVPIHDPEAIYTEFELAIKNLVAEKTAL